jgi:hypothetical protein
MKPHHGNMSIKIPYVRNDTSSTLLTLSAASLLLLSSAVLPLSNPLLLQPVQAQTTLSFKTPSPAIGLKTQDTLTFDAQGTTTSGSSDVKVTSGTLKINYAGQQQPLSIDNFRSGSFTNDSSGWDLTLTWNSGEGATSSTYTVATGCSASDATSTLITLFTFNEQNPQGSQESYQGPVECSSSSQGGGGGGNTTTTPTATDTTTPSPQQQPSSSPMTGSSQGTDRGSSSSSSGSNSTDSNSNSKDSDSDGVPDSSDNCTHTSQPRCFKEDTTTQQQSSTPIAGNQTR